ncbi:MAG: indolepyruvate ferredoxin oxidoreductase family protein [Burkholderiaceae bacterium]|nr:indolepyruvate ferredoxin oxidoreductase family protein [Burkholderiaceae bacterium]
MKETLYGRKDTPAIIGKSDERGKSLFQSEMALDSNQIAIAIGERLLELNHDDALATRVSELRAFRKPSELIDPIARSFYFCAGCPHNSSTVVPAGSQAYAGIGCSWMAQSMQRSTLGYTQMGGEGLSWVGEAPFSKRNHMFQNMGDGTYFHSGLLAIRAAVSAKTNITFKILYNDAVAMTGGQKHDGPLDPARIAHQCHAEGVQRIAVVTDEPDKYSADVVWPVGVQIHHRDELDWVQRQLREIPGTTILIYDQTCAAEKRRRRKRGSFPDPAKRVVINDLICEGCGDCGVQSNCVAIQPLETEFGRKRTIDQSACNKDFSCLKGFCPSFVTVQGGQLRKPAPVTLENNSPLPDPDRPNLEHGVYSVLVAGMGGTGVVTIGAILGMAAHLEGKGCGLLDMAGLAQKGGSVWSHLRFGLKPEDIKTIRIAAGGANLILGCDMIVAGHTKTLNTVRSGVTTMIINSNQSMPGDFTRNADLKFPDQQLKQNIEQTLGLEQCAYIDASKWAVDLLGDSIASNLLMVGYAYQRGLIPLGAEAIETAIQLNGTSAEMNLAAFRWGRTLAVDPIQVQANLQGKDRPILMISPAKTDSLESTIGTRAKFLEQYQNRKLANQYLELVSQTQRFETSAFPGKTDLTDAVARYYFKLLAIKDEYEVARLHTESKFLDSISSRFEGDYRLTFHLAPPLMSKSDAHTGLPRKREFGPWIISAFRLLAKLKFLRGTMFDIFGVTHERRMERNLITQYEDHIQRILDVLKKTPTTQRYESAVALARIPEEIRGYGHVKLRNVQSATKKAKDLLDHLEGKVIEIKRAA